MLSIRRHYDPDWNAHHGRKPVFLFNAQLPLSKARRCNLVVKRMSVSLIKTDNWSGNPLRGSGISSKRLYKISLLVLTCMCSMPLYSETPSMKIRITVDHRSLTATLVDSPTARDFLSLLPLTLALEDYAGTEKIAYLPRELSTEKAPAGVDPAVGDITYYAPWGNLALFYRDFGYAKGLIKLGRIDKGANLFNVPGSVTVAIEPWQK